MTQGYQDTFLGGGGGGEFTDDLFGVGKISSGQIAEAERAGISYAQAAGAHHGGGSLLGNLLGDVRDTALGLPQGIAGLVRASSIDAERLFTGDVPALLHDSQLYEKAAKPMAKQYAYQYGPLAHLDVGEFYDRFHEHPLGPFLDIAEPRQRRLGVRRQAR
jgi:hypothetical protein